jgi:hypothetical protein
MWFSSSAETLPDHRLTIKRECIWIVLIDRRLLAFEPTDCLRRLLGIGCAFESPMGKAKDSALESDVREVREISYLAQCEIKTLLSA